MRNEITVPIDIRETAKEYFKIHIQYKNLRWFKLGLWFIKIGCLISGFYLVDEIPISLLDSHGKEIER